MTYERFLRSCGRGPIGKSFLTATGEDWYYPAALEFFGIASELFRESTGAQLPDGYLVVGQYQGYQFFCVDTADADERVLHYMETDADFSSTGESLRELFEDVIARDEAGAPYRSEPVGNGISRMVFDDDPTNN